MAKNKILTILKSIYLCIRFPFLYPRNRFTGRHWNNHKLDCYIHGHPAVYKSIKDENGAYKSVKVKEATDGIYGKAFETYSKEIDGTEYIGDRVKSYPWLVWYGILKFLYDYFLPLFHCIPTYTELDSLDTGWKKAFGIQICKEIKEALIKSGGRRALYQYRIIQIKEKWGYLHWYDNGPKEVQAVIFKYEKISERTCIICGKPAKWITPYEVWRLPYCDKHVPNYVAKNSLEEVK